MFTIRIESLHVHASVGMDEALTLLRAILAQGAQIMMSQEQMAAKMNELDAQLGKVASETGGLKNEVAALKDELAKGPVSAELQAAFDKVAARVQAIDDMVPDAPAPVPPAV